MSRSRSRSPPRRARSGSRDRGGSTANEEEGGNTSLLVRNVPFSIHPEVCFLRVSVVQGGGQFTYLFAIVISLQELKDDFAQHGEVRDVYIPKDFNTG